MCGFTYCDNDYFFKSGVAEARRLVERLGCNRDSRVVDIGCGAGRVAIGLVQEVGQVRYCGLDAYKPFVGWCRRHIERHHPSFRFVHVDVENERYNPNGTKLSKDFVMPLPNGQVDIVYLWGLFTNLAPEDMQIYVREISRVARPGAGVFLTAFVEEGVPAVALNPSAYVDYRCDGPLCVVRYEKNFLFEIFAKNGLSVDEFAHHGGAHSMQSEIYLKKRSSESVFKVAALS
jgi:SAM-dependent methyltransferase